MSVFVTQYDTDITPLLVKKIEHPIGDYIAKEIVQLKNSLLIHSRKIMVLYLPTN